jgi:hypothetical protein
VRGGFFGRYLPSGHLVYVRGGSLYGVPFDIDRLKGPPATLLEDVAATNYGGGQLDFSRNGTLVYLSGKASAPVRTLVWIEAGGKRSRSLPLLTDLTLPRFPSMGRGLPSRSEPSAGGNPGPTTCSGRYRPN